MKITDKLGPGILSESDDEPKPQTVTFTDKKGTTVKGHDKTATTLTLTVPSTSLLLAVPD